jgi:hypothetical protein
MSALDYALEYAAAGVAVIPCEPASKEPVWSLVPKEIGPDRKPVSRSGGVKKATRDPTKITEWWTMRPDAMIGAATGTASGFWAIDPDVPKPANIRTDMPANRPLTVPPHGQSSKSNTAGTNQRSK